jgi:eukaryotic-like serine/threonine-protein kinase
VQGGFNRSHSGDAGKAVQRISREFRQPMPDALTEHFYRLSTLPPDRRQAHLETLEQSSPELTEKLKGLLKAHDQAEGFLDSFDPQAASQLLDEDERLAMPDQVGPFRLLREIGRGGLGVVYLAERVGGDFEQRVAVKLIKRGMDSELILKRFYRERRILASLEHANIARLIDGGMLEDGRPYFAMEYIDGVPITTWCDEQRATIGQRLRLFEQVCRAVQYAHTRLVVHRDLKPANILVTVDMAIPKLLDFGIAKLTNEEAENGTALTVAGIRAMTPEYAAPEQIRGEPVSVATDVYALGVVLYELLTGHHPFDRDADSRQSMATAICDTTPLLPSVSVTGSPGVSRARSNRPQSLRRTLRGDLDNIVLRAMAKEPARRYGSAEALAEDIRRHLEGLPVKARPDTAVYRARRFISRHALSVATTAAFVLLLMASIVALVIQQADTVRERDQARLERDKAEAVTDFLRGLFDEADPFKDHLGTMTVQDALETGAQRLDSELHDRPAIRAHLLRTIGWIYLQHYQPQRAEPFVEEALRLERELHDEPHPDLADSLGIYSTHLSRAGDKEGALAHMREAREMRRQIYGDDSPIVARSLATVGLLLMEAGRCLEAEPLLREGLIEHERITGERGLMDAGYKNILGRTLISLGQYEEAEALLREATEIRSNLLAPDHPMMATVHGTLGVTLMHQGRFSEAETLIRTALEINHQALGKDHYRVALLLNHLGQVRWALGESDEAAELHRQAHAIRQSNQFHDQARKGRGLTLMARLEHIRGNLEDSEQLFMQALAAYPDQLSETDLRIAETWLGLGWLLVNLGRTVEAEPLLEDAMARRLAGTGSGSDLTAEARVALGLLRASQGHTEEALSLIEPGLQRLDQFALADPDMVEAARRVLAEHYDRAAGAN